MKGNPDCDSSNLDESINHMNNRLMDCNQKLSDRQGKLEEALVQCGQFSDAAESILQWLEETHDLIEGQGPISAADPNVLKAQIMEQKVFDLFVDWQSMEQLIESFLCWLKNKRVHRFTQAID